MATTTRGTAPAWDVLSTAAWRLDRLALLSEWTSASASACMSGILHHGGGQRGERVTWQSSAPRVVPDRAGTIGRVTRSVTRSVIEEERVRAAVV
ncbi:hypothetical protein acdb102_47830 [Acidothermaceae bacterium B102]|nr:hypothetical protein acdb102_47830 [Acidothermaceae bacterium B102]